MANFVIFSPFTRCNFKIAQEIFTKPSLFYTSWGLVVNQYGRQGERSKVKLTEVKNYQFGHLVEGQGQRSISFWREIVFWRENRHNCHFWRGNQ